MTIDQVSAALPLNWLGAGTLLLVLAASLFLFIAAAVLADSGDGSVKFHIFVFGLAAASFLFAVWAGYMNYWGKDAKIEAWNASYAQPFLISLPVQSKEAEVLYIGPLNKETGLRLVSVSLPENASTVSIEAKVETKSVERPVFSYRELEKDIGSQYKKGPFDASLAVSDSKLEWRDNPPNTQKIGDLAEAGKFLVGLVATLYPFIAIGLSVSFLDETQSNLDRARSQRESAAARRDRGERPENEEIAALRRANEELSRQLNEAKEAQKEETRIQEEERIARKRAVRG